MKKYLLPCFILLLSACGSIKPAPPALPLSHIDTEPLPDSQIDLLVSINLQDVFNDFTAKIPLQLSGQGTTGPAQYRWQVQRQPFNLTLSSNTLNIADAAHFTGGGYIKNPLNGNWVSVASCNTDAFIGISASFAVTKNYFLSSNVKLTQLDLNACNLNVVNFDVSPIIKSKITGLLNDQLKNISQQINQYNFRSLLQPAWDQLNNPVKIGDLGYIVINPSSVRLSQPLGSGNILSLTAGITAKPVFYLSNPGKLNASPVPDVSGNSTNTSGFNITLDMHHDYQTLNERLKANINNQTINTGNGGYIIIKDADLYGTGNNHLFIKVKFTGKQNSVPYHGTLYFTCIPQYDAKSGDLYISSIDFDFNTITRLKEGPAVWILSSAIKKYLNNQVHFNISGQIKNLKNNLNIAINKPLDSHVSLQGKINSIELVDILPLKDYILIRASATGDLGLRMN